ncbi:MAG: ORF6N domain-containing protein [Bacteroidales bacterium]|nr:ORF6N domain-containing protein [Bacteroidales bacterium]
MEKLPVLKEDNITNYIYLIRGEKVIFDFDLAMLYGVETRALKQQVRRNIDRFPVDFMFQLTKIEWKELITNCDKLNQYKFSPITPFAFTEQGIAMLSSVLKSKKAIQVNIAIMRTFVQIRKLMQTNKDLADKIEKLETKYNEQFKLVFKVIKQLIKEKVKPRRRIGFKNFENE